MQPAVQRRLSENSGLVQNIKAVLLLLHPTEKLGSVVREVQNCIHLHKADRIWSSRVHADAVCAQQKVWPSKIAKQGST